jgi:hypothetical protein
LASSLRCARYKLNLGKASFHLKACVLICRMGLYHLPDKVMMEPERLILSDVSRMTLHFWGLLSQLALDIVALHSEISV